jgi:hypothetical protein
MKVAERRFEKQARPLLRVYRGDEPDEAAVAIDLDHDPTPHRSAAELDAFWAGRKPAARLSARVAA